VRAGDKNFPLQDAASNQGDLILTVLAVTIELIAKYFLHLRETTGDIACILDRLTICHVS